jgi:5-methyltetrahydropteroyltriglutamate--homocysteine methyltransferase
MKRSTDRFLTTHVGSRIRRPEVVELTAARTSGQAIDEDALTSTLRVAVADVVNQQVQPGIDVTSDGDFGAKPYAAGSARDTSEHLRLRR